jgi:N-[(2S)-2-amino-2-carboxyethyl]-L-glutamate dehydrogenase
MLVLDEKDILSAGINWSNTIEEIRKAVYCLENKDYAQPLKPYLRYRDMKNRIIAMPAFVGGDINMAGIKWIASFPDNIHKGLPRAHSVIILNDPDSGVPVAVINTALLSIIRTASVSGLVLKCFDDARKQEKITVGICGLGPIGQYHIKMCQALLGERIGQINAYDLRSVDVPDLLQDERIRIVDSWQEAYENADVFITSTVSAAPYIDLPPKKGSLHLNVSLRDYKSMVYQWFKEALIVDDWDEVCREKTDVEMMYLHEGLKKENTFSIIDMLKNNWFEKINTAYAVMFNPMGMSSFDIAIASHYYRQFIREENIHDSSAARQMQAAV